MNARAGSLGGRPRRDPFAIFGQLAPIPRPHLPYQADGDQCDRTGRVMIWRCPETQRGYLMRQACTKLDCATCYPRVARRRGQRAYGQIGGAALGAFVFTVPYELRAVVGLEQAKELRRQLVAVVKSWAADRWGAAVGFRVAFHPSGDRCAACSSRAGRGKRIDRAKTGAKKAPAWLTGKCQRCGAPPSWLPHFDVLIPMVGLRNGQPIRLPFQLQPQDLADVKRRWSAVILKVAAASGAQLRDRTRDLLTEGRAIVHYTFRTKTRQKRHRLRYSLRPFPAWARTLGRSLAPQSYGLAAPNSKAPGIKAWREAVSGTTEAAAGPVCACCAEPKPLYLDDVCAIWGDKWRAYSALPWLSDGDP